MIVILCSQAKAFLNILQSFSGQKTVSFYIRKKENDFAEYYSEGNFDMKNRWIQTMTMSDVLKRFQKMFQEGGMAGVSIRQFTNEIDPKSNLPIKIIYGWMIKNQRVRRLSPDEMQECENLDQSPEEAVRFG